MTFTEKKMVTEDYLKGCTSQGYRSEYLTDEAIGILLQAKCINPDGEYVFMPNGKPLVTLTFNKLGISFIHFLRNHSNFFPAAQAPPIFAPISR